MGESISRYLERSEHYMKKGSLECVRSPHVHKCKLAFSVVKIHPSRRNYHTSKMPFGLPSNGAYIFVNSSEIIFFDDDRWTGSSEIMVENILINIRKRTHTHMIFGNNSDPL